MTEYIYLNLRNGIAKESTQHYAESIHFLSIPEWSENLLNEKIEKMVVGM